MSRKQVIVLCTRKDGISDEDLERLQAEHVEIVRGFMQGVVTTYAYTIPTALPGSDRPPYDLVVDMTVSSFEDFMDRLQTPEGQAAVAHANTYNEKMAFLFLEPTQMWG